MIRCFGIMPEPKSDTTPWGPQSLSWQTSRVEFDVGLPTHMRGGRTNRLPGQSFG